MPVSDTRCQLLHIAARDGLVQARDQDTAADRMDRLTRNDLRFDGDAEIQPELQKQFVEDVLLRASRFDVVEASEQRVVQSVWSRIPSADVGGVPA